MSKTLYVSDLDGTLLQPDARLSAATVKMLNEATASGKLFTVATARTPATVAPILENVVMTMPAIVMTGAAFWDRATGLYSRERLIDSDAAARLLDAYRRTGTPTFVYSLSDNMITIRHTGPLDALQRQFLEERTHTPFKSIDIGADGESQFPERLDDVILLYSMVPNAEGERAFAEIRDIPGVRPQCYHDIYGADTLILEAFSPEATKAKAMRAMAEMCGADKIVAFGDNVNDLPMMREADIAVAVENALPEVKEAADIVIGPNTSDAVAKFILDH